MNVLTDEQNLLRDSVERFVSNQYDFVTRRRIVEGDASYLPEHWQQFADLGWLAAAFTEEDGGLSGKLSDIAVIQEQLGRALFVGPYFSSALLAGQLIARRGTLAQKESLLGPLIDGSRLFAFAYAEPQSRYNLADVTTRGQLTESGYRLNGSKSVVLYGAQAHCLIVCARTGGEQRDGQGLSLFVLDTDCPGVSLRDYRTVDGACAAELTLEDVHVSTTQLLGAPDDAFEEIEGVCDFATLCLCAEAVGCMGALYEQTLDYLKQREQFGVPLSSFQALQHRMVDVFMSYELSKSMTYAALERFHEQPPTERKRMVSATKTQIGQGGRHVGQEAIQMHGGMGMTNELPIGHYFKRLTVINTMFGDSAFHLQRFRQLDGE